MHQPKAGSWAIVKIIFSSRMQKPMLKFGGTADFPVKSAAQCYRVHQGWDKNEQWNVDFCFEFHVNCCVLVEKTPKKDLDNFFKSACRFNIAELPLWNWPRRNWNQITFLYDYHADCSPSREYRWRTLDVCALNYSFAWSAAPYPHALNGDLFAYKVKSFVAKLNDRKVVW